GEVGYGIRDTQVDPTETFPKIALMTVGEMQQTEIAELLETDRRRQAQMVETLRVMGDMRREMGDMHAKLLALREQIMAPVTRQGPSNLPNNTNPNNTTPESVQAMIDQTLMQNSTNGDGIYNGALTWWNSQIRSLDPDAYSMTWEVLKNKMTDKYCPQVEIKKLEIELWNLKAKENNVPAYNERFQEQTLICTKFVADETEKIDKYVSGLPNNIYGSMKALKPRTLDETIELVNDLMDQKLYSYAERQTINKRKTDDSFRCNHGHQQ
nr:reverse transcriptase domain-containing protein [Tanacetum cinerariifolium]